LRSFPGDDIVSGIAPDAVGCGHAALDAHSPSGGSQLLIIRLADGVSWLLDSPSDNHWFWGTPLAVTCDEVFTMWGPGGSSHVRRIRLDSLGPGIPPD
jgi:hypothetical protein